MAANELMTADDLWKIEDDGRHELIRGEPLYRLVMLLAERQVHEHGRIFVGDTGFRILEGEENRPCPRHCHRAQRAAHR
jgi:hypothetical protein